MGRRCEAGLVFPPTRSVFGTFRLAPLGGIGIIVLKRSPCRGGNRTRKLDFSIRGNISVPPSLIGVCGRLRSSLKYAVPDRKYLAG